MKRALLSLSSISPPNIYDIIRSRRCPVTFVPVVEYDEYSGRIHALLEPVTMRVCDDRPFALVGVALRLLVQAISIVSVRACGFCAGPDASDVKSTVTQLVDATLRGPVLARVGLARIFQLLTRPLGSQLAELSISLRETALFAMRTGMLNLYELLSDISHFTSETIELHRELQEMDAEWENAERILELVSALFASLSRISVLLSEAATASSRGGATGEYKIL